MKAFAPLLLVAVLFAAGGSAADPESQPATAPADAAQGPVRFAAVHVSIDSGDTPLAAYQFELVAKTGRVALVGLEGGDAAAFKAAPYYDPKALLANKVVVAAFSTAVDLPRGKTRVATLMVQITGDADPTYAATLQAAAGGDGQSVSAQVIVNPIHPAGSVVAAKPLGGAKS